MGLLTDFFTDVAVGVGSAYFNQPQPNVQHFAGSPQGYAPGGGFAMDAPGGGLPFFDVVPEPSQAVNPCGPFPVLKRVCGQYKWIYPKRRRRKQLLSRSDARGLAALKGILGNGKAMEVWIATHGC